MQAPAQSALPPGLNAPQLVPQSSNLQGRLDSVNFVALQGSLARDDLWRETTLFERLLYKNHNQHRTAKHYHKLAEVRRLLRLLRSLQLSQLIGELHGLTRRAHGVGLTHATASYPAYDRDLHMAVPSGQAAVLVLQRLLAACRIVEALLPAIHGAAGQLLAQLAMSYFMPFSLTATAMLARILATSAQVLLDASKAYNSLVELVPALPFGPLAGANVAGLDALPMMVKCDWKNALPQVCCIPFPAEEPLHTKITQLAAAYQPATMPSSGQRSTDDLGQKVSQSDLTAGSTAQRSMDDLGKKVARATSTPRTPAGTAWSPAGPARIADDVGQRVSRVSLGARVNAKAHSTASPARSAASGRQQSNLRGTPETGTGAVSRNSGHSAVHASGVFAERPSQLPALAVFEDRGCSATPSPSETAAAPRYYPAAPVLALGSILAAPATATASFDSTVAGPVAAAPAQQPPVPPPAAISAASHSEEAAHASMLGSPAVSPWPAGQPAALQQEARQNVEPVRPASSAVELDMPRHGAAVSQPLKYAQPKSAAPVADVKAAAGGSGPGGSMLEQFRAASRAKAAAPAFLRLGAAQRPAAHAGPAAQQPAGQLAGPPHGLHSREAGPPATAASAACTAAPAACSVQPAATLAAEPVVSYSAAPQAEQLASGVPGPDNPELVASAQDVSMNMQQSILPQKRSLEPIAAGVLDYTPPGPPAKTARLGAAPPPQEVAWPEGSPSIADVRPEAAAIWRIVDASAAAEAAASVDAGREAEAEASNGMPAAPGATMHMPMSDAPVPLATCRSAGAHSPTLPGATTTSLGVQTASAPASARAAAATPASRPSPLEFTSKRSKRRKGRASSAAADAELARMSPSELLRRQATLAAQSGRQVAAPLVSGRISKGAGQPRAHAASPSGSGIVSGAAQGGRHSASLLSGGMTGGSPQLRTPASRSPAAGANRDGPGGVAGSNLLAGGRPAIASKQAAQTASPAAERPLGATSEPSLHGAPVLAGPLRVDEPLRPLPASTGRPAGAGSQSPASKANAAIKPKQVADIFDMLLGGDDGL